MNETTDLKLSVLSWIPSESVLMVMINSRIYEYQLEFPTYVKFRQLIKHSPGKALVFLKEHARLLGRREDLEARHRGLGEAAFDKFVDHLRKQHSGVRDKKPLTSPDEKMKSDNYKFEFVSDYNSFGILLDGKPVGALSFAQLGDALRGCIDDFIHGVDLMNILPVVLAYVKNPYPDRSPRLIPLAVWSTKSENELFSGEWVLTADPLSHTRFKFTHVALNHPDLSSGLGYSSAPGKCDRGPDIPIASISLAAKLMGYYNNFANSSLFGFTNVSI